jgi:hypothetical protein
MIKKQANGKFKVTSEDGNKILGKDMTKEEAKERIKQVEIFKRIKNKVKK